MRVSALIFVIACSSAIAQEWLFNMTSPNPPPFTLSLGGESLSASEASFFSDKLQYSKSEAKILAPLVETESYRSIMQLQGAHHSFSQEGALPDNPVPNDLYSIEIGHSLFMREEPKKIWGLNIQLHSHSDEPYSEMDVTELSVTGLKYWATTPTDAWIVSLNYSNRRELIGDHIPLPGFQYLYTPNRSFFLLVGVPANGFTWSLDGGIKLSYFVFIFNHMAKVSYALNSKTELYTQFIYKPTLFRLKEESDDDKKIYLENKKVTLGVKYALSEALTLDIFGGKVFDFRLYQTDKRDGEKDWLEEIRDQLFFNIQLGIRL